VTTHFIRREAFVLLLLACYAAAQAVQPERFERDFNALFSGGEYMNLYAMGTLDHRSRDQVNSNSEATVSKFDLKAPGRAKDAYTHALQAMAKNDLKSAVEALQKAIALYPNYVAAHNALGCNYFQLKEYEQARKEFAQAIQLDDHLSSSYLNQGRAQLALGQTSDAQASMEKASSIAPLDHHLLLALAYAQYVNHDYPATIKTAKRAHASSHPETAIVHYFAAASWQALNNLEETRNELQTFLAEDPKSSFAAAAQRAVDQIRAADERPLSLAMNVPTSTPTVALSPTRGQEVLQDLREKQQIAEAESEGSTCSSCVTVKQPGPAGPATASLSDPTSGIRDSNLSPLSFISTVNEVAVFFSATDSGRSVTDLSQKDVKVLDDHKPPVVVRSFHSESDLPLRLGLLIDTSASVRERFSFEQNAALNFVNQVATGKDDLAFVAGFSNSVVLANDFTSDLKELEHGIHQLVPIGGTAIWDAIAFAADKLGEKKEDRPVARILVVISDGVDNASSATLKQAIERAERNEIIVYTVSTRYADDPQQGDLTGNRAMKVLAQLTGGVAFFPGSASHLNRSLAELQQVIRSRYLISYRPADFNHDGRYRPIAIIAEKSGRKLKVNARKGYYSTTRSADDSRE